jgi:hypothetical protein
MNIFALDRDPQLCASYHNDSHVVKMITEHMQMLNANAKLLSKTSGKIAWINHPCTIWLRESRENLEWLNKLQFELNFEWQKRWNHPCNLNHRGYDLWRMIYDNKHLRNFFPDVPMTPFAQAMPDECKRENPVEGYRVYYKTHKQSIAKWKTQTPFWYSV